MQGPHSCRSRFTKRSVLGMCALGRARGSLPLAACARRVVGMSELQNAWGSLPLAACTRRVLWYVCVGKCFGLASGRRLRSKVAGMCALDNKWCSLRSPPALEGCLVCVRLTWLEPKSIRYVLFFFNCQNTFNL